MACFRGNINIVKYLINKKVNIEHKNFKNETSFIIACQQNHTDIIKLLIDNKVDTTQKDQNNNSGFYYLSQENKSIIKSYIKNDTKTF